ncbi:MULTISPECIES: hypothetical protein [unclassified Synechococcus]|uniref:hypothetical protein n=1 Tax=unclassified Synechococcus TaxID=2626047 RepID=UPI0039B1240D
MRNSDDDVLSGESINNRLYVGSGIDPLIVQKGVASLSEKPQRSGIGLQRTNGYTITEDFTDGQNLIQLGVETSGLQRNTTNDETLLSQQSDLVTSLEDPSGIHRSGNFLV